MKMTASVSLLSAFVITGLALGDALPKSGDWLQFRIYAVPRDTVLAVRAGGRGDVTQTHRSWTGRKGTNVPSPVVYERHLLVVYR